MSDEIEKIYDAKKVEDKWYQHWQSNGYFKANPNPKKKPFTIVIPPPNVTGALHMGHAYNNTIQDILIRWKRMQGFEALYQPGTDHAGIATQTVVEREIAKEGKHRRDLGREKFVEKVWEWKEKYGNTITTQLKKMGISADWSRDRFTLDKGLSDGVQEVFIQLYNKGLIYKGHRIVNWDPASATALADDEVETKEVQGKLYHIKYKIKDTNEFIVVATTRPETLFGDSGVAISPDDLAKQNLIGKTVIIPFVNREVSIFADEYVDKNFGSGFVKMTPAHDNNDFEVGKRHNLKQFLVLDKDANVMPFCIEVNGRDQKNELAIPAEFVGKHRFEARKLIIKKLEDLGQIEKIEDYTHSIGHSYRSKVPVEPYLSEQWFVKMKPMAEKALAALQDGTIKFYPEGRYEKNYEHWMLNIKDWCISRQLWWGHRIPAWYNANGDIKVGATDPSTATEKWTQDEDVLDTWFSSWLWPFSTMGWPQQTKDLEYFYPSDVLVTASEIIFFWVARMIMAGYEFLGKAPFHTVYFNGTVRDEQGRKMSKSLNNGIDPLDMIEKFSTDSVRYTVVQLSAQGQDIKLAEKDFEMGRNFSNKIWNSFRFLNMNLNGDLKNIDDVKDHLETADKWILSRLQKTSLDVQENLERYRFQDAQQAIYSFYWNDYCDWYLELIKIRLFKPENTLEKDTALSVAAHVLKQSMVLLHPFMPFVTEEIWQAFKQESDTESIMLSQWPTVEKKLENNSADRAMDIIMQVIIALRNLRAEMNISYKSELILEVLLNDKHAKTIKENEHYIHQLTKSKTVNLVEQFGNGSAGNLLVDGTEIKIPLEGMIDVTAEKQRLSKEIERKQSLIKSTEGKLSNEKFVSGAPINVVQAEKDKLISLKHDIDIMQESLNKLG